MSNIFRTFIAENQSLEFSDARLKWAKPTFGRLQEFCIDGVFYNHQK